MKLTAFICILCFINLFSVSAQQSNKVTTFDFVKIKDAKYKKEVLYFFENNWKVYRDIALQQKHISSYQLITTKTTATADFDIILITEYPDSTAYRLREQHFEKIMKDIRPRGAIQMNNSNPRELFEIRFATNGEVLFGSDKKN